MESSLTPHLSVAIIARNAGEAIFRTIRSVKGIAGEVVVLDTGSTDHTQFAAHEAGAKVHRASWQESFAAARNECLTHVRGDWVLWLDAGEGLAADQAAALKSALDKELELDHAYRLFIELPSVEGKIDGERVSRLRLHPRRPDIQFVGRLRETIEPALVQAGVAIGSLPITIERSAKDNAAAVKAAKAQRNIRLADLQLAEDGPSAGLHNILGEAFQNLQDSARAGQQYRRALELAAAGSPDQLEAWYGLLTCLDGAADNRSAQLSLAMGALEKFPLDAQLLVAMGGYLQSLGHLALAGRSYDIAFRHGQVCEEIWHLPRIKEIAAVCAASAWQLAGDDDAARSLLEAAVRYHPQSPRLVRQLVELHVKHGRRDEALAAIASLPEGRESLAAAIRGACLAQKANWLAAKAHLQLAVEHGCRERFCFRWLLVTWLGLGRADEALAVLEHWRTFDAQNPELTTLADAIAEHQIVATTSEPPRGSDEYLRLDAADDSQLVPKTVSATSSRTANPA